MFSPAGQLEETTGTSSYSIVEDYPAGPEIQEPLSPNGAIDVAQNSSLTETDVWISRYALFAVQAGKEEEWRLLQTIHFEHRMVCLRHTWIS